MSLAAAEYRKISRRRLYPVMALVLMLFVGLAAFFLVVFGQIAPDVAEGLPTLRRPEVFSIGAQQAATQTWFPVILAVVIFGGELGTTVWATSLTRDSRKFNHVLIRLITYTIASLVAFVAAFGFWTLLALVFADGEGFMPVSELLGFLWKSAVVAFAWSSLGVGAVALLRSIGPAIGVGLAIVFAEGFLALWGPWENVSISAATTGLFPVDFGGPFQDLIPGFGLPLWHQLAILAGWSVLGLLLTWWGLQRRDA